MKKSKIIIWILVFIFLVSSIYAMQPSDFLEKLKSTEKINDGICNDGENFLFDDDCNFTTSMLLCQNDCVFNYIWFARLIIIIAFVMIILKPEKWKVILLFSAITLSFFFITPPLNETKSLNTTKCIAKYEPVCANQTTFINSCEAQQAGFFNWTKGKCNSNILPKSDIELFWDKITSFGAKLMPHHPMIGWLIIFLFFFIAFKIYDIYDLKYKFHQLNKRRQ